MRHGKPLDRWKLRVAIVLEASAAGHVFLARASAVDRALEHAASQGRLAYRAQGSGLNAEPFGLRVGFYGLQRHSLIGSLFRTEVQ